MCHWGYCICPTGSMIYDDLLDVKWAHRPWLQLQKFRTQKGCIAMVIENSTHTTNEKLGWNCESLHRGLLKQKCRLTRVVWYPISTTPFGVLSSVVIFVEVFFVKMFWWLIAVFFSEKTCGSGRTVHKQDEHEGQLSFQTKFLAAAHTKLDQFFSCWLLIHFYFGKPSFLLPWLANKEIENHIKVNDLFNNAPVRLLDLPAGFCLCNACWNELERRGATTRQVERWGTTELSHFGSNDTPHTPLAFHRMTGWKPRAILFIPAIDSTHRQALLLLTAG